MTMIETETIGCPACKVEQDVDVYQTINAMENPELLQKLMAGEIKIGLGYNALLQADLTHNESVRYYSYVI